MASQSTQALLKSYPSLKQRLLIVTLQQQPEEVMLKTSQSEANEQYIEGLEELCTANGLDRNFRDQFMMVFENIRKK